MASDTLKGGHRTSQTSQNENCWFNTFQLAGDGFTTTLPAKSVVVLEAEPGTACPVQLVWQLVDPLAHRLEPVV